MNLALPVLLILAVVTDFRERRISNRLIASGLFLGLALRILVEGSAGVVHFLGNISIPVIMLFLLFQMRALGAGDIKLFSVIGGFLTTRQLLCTMAASFVIGAAVGAGKIVYLICTAGYSEKKRTLIHFSFAILIACFIVIWGCAIE